MKTFLAFLALQLFGLLVSCHGQPSKQQTSKDLMVGGGCDGCEIMYIGMPQNIHAVDTSAGWHERGQKLKLSGTVYQRDGKTPAAGIVLYYWQTDHFGLYQPVSGMDPKAARHGHIRGWVKTGANGKYTIFTVRPKPYPNTGNPAHIHVSVKEPGLSEYYIDELVFDDDQFLTAARKNRMENRGGSGILKIFKEGDQPSAKHDIILGLNIPDYPKNR